MYSVYILTNKWQTVLYTGLTDNLEVRLLQHKDRVFDGFTKRYNCDVLVYFEFLETADEANRREKQIEGWTRVKKVELIQSRNPEWPDLSKGILRSAQDSCQ